MKRPFLHNRGFRIGVGRGMLGGVQSPRRPLSDALKLFLPSWKFFADFAEVPCLELRVGEGAWKDLFPPQEVSGLGRLLFNAAGNQRLLEQSQIDRAVDALEDLREEHPADWRELFQATERHALLKQLVRSRGREQFPEVVPERTILWQFRLRSIHPGGSAETLFVSEPFPGGESCPPNS